MLFRSILEAARELFVTEGYEAVSMRKIAERIEYSAPALYFHFQDKAALLQELCGRDFLALARTFNGLAGIADPLERLRQIGRAYVQFALAHPQQYRFMFLTPLPEVPHDEAPVEKGNPAQDAYALLRVTVSECIFEGRLRPELTDPDLVSQMVWAATHGLIALHIVMAGSRTWVEWRPAESTADELIEVLIRGLARSRET